MACMRTLDLVLDLAQRAMGLGKATQGFLMQMESTGELFTSEAHCSR